MSGMNKFSIEVHRVHVELGGKLLNSLRIETQFLERLQSVGVVDGAAHTQLWDTWFQIESYFWRQGQHIYRVGLASLHQCLG